MSETASPFRWRAFLGGFWLNPREHPDFAWVFAGRSLFVLGFGLVYAYQRYILTDYVGLTSAAANRLIGALTVAGVAATVLGVVVGGWLTDRWQRRTIFLVIAAALLAVALAIPLFSPTTAAMAAFAVIQGIASGLSIACGMALVVDILPDRGGGAAKDLGIYNVATNIPQTLAPAVAGLIVHLFDGYRPLFAVAVVVVAGSGILVSRVGLAR